VPFPNRLLAASTKRRDNQGVRTADQHLGCVPCVRPCPKAQRRQRARTSAKNRTYAVSERRVPIDGNGNLVSEGREWDARDRLVSGGYGYDTGNLRVKMGEQTVLLDGIEEAREYGGVEARYEHDPWRVDALLAQTTSAGKGYFVTDALGSVYAVVDGSGAVVSKYGYDVYGARTAVTEGMATGWGFTGRRHDGEGEMYYRARHYQAVIGILTSADPLLGDIQRLNSPAGPFVGWPQPYQYVRGRPANQVDPTGLTPSFVGGCPKGVEAAYFTSLAYVQRATNDDSPCPCLGRMWTGAWKWNLNALKTYLTVALERVVCEAAPYYEPWPPESPTPTFVRACAFAPPSRYGEVHIAPSLFPAGRLSPTCTTGGGACLVGAILHEAAHQDPGFQHHHPESDEDRALFTIGTCPCFGKGVL
jgi:RHS repeat-associated protein